jgi:hypothetical protein
MLLRVVLVVMGLVALAWAVGLLLQSFRGGARADDRRR